MCVESGGGRWTPEMCDKAGYHPGEREVLHSAIDQLLLIKQLSQDGEFVMPLSAVQEQFESWEINVSCSRLVYIQLPALFHRFYFRPLPRTCSPSGQVSLKWMVAPLVSIHVWIIR